MENFVKAMGTINVGIDQSLSSTGLVADTGQGIYYEVIETKKGDGSQKDKLSRIQFIADTITTRLMEFQNHFPFHEVEVKIEGLSYGSSGKMASASRDLAGLQFVIMDYLEKTGFDDIVVVEPRVLKKFATGSGNAKKDDMLESTPKSIQEYICNKFKKTKGRYDVVDAFWLSQYNRPEEELKWIERSREIDKLNEL